MDILNDPRRVFNFDETAMYLNPTKKYVLSRKGAKNVYSVTDNEKECLTVLLGGNANGECPPPMILFRYERVPKHISSCIPKSIKKNSTKSGWMNSGTFYEYITETFVPWIQEQNVPLPIFVYLDGHASHLSLSLCQFCNENNIILIALPPNSTHILQPVDVGIIFPLKSIWKRKRLQWDAANMGEKFNRLNFANLLADCLAKLAENQTLWPHVVHSLMGRERVIHIRKKSPGLYPFDVEAVKYNRILAGETNSLTSSNHSAHSSGHEYMENLINRYEERLLAQFVSCAGTDEEWEITKGDDKDDESIRPEDPELNDDNVENDENNDDDFNDAIDDINDEQMQNVLDEVFDINQVDFEYIDELGAEMCIAGKHETVDAGLESSEMTAGSDRATFDASHSASEASTGPVPTNSSTIEAITSSTSATDAEPTPSTSKLIGMKIEMVNNPKSVAASSIAVSANNFRGGNPRVRRKYNIKYKPESISIIVLISRAVSMFFIV